VNSESKVLNTDELVLIVDDDQGLSQTLVDILTLEGIAAIVAGSAEAALELTTLHDPKAVVVDYHLPDGTGIELAQTIMERKPDTPVLMLTGFASLDTAIAAVGRLDAYLIKPVAPPIFVRSVADALTRRRLIAENKSLVGRLQRVNAYQALYDHLTGLPNRALLDDRLAQALSGCQRSGRSMAVLFIDLDGFKVVNDLFGHQVGDVVLREMATRLADNCRSSDSVARFGGDEFVLVCPDVEVTSDACLMATHLLKAMSEPMTIDGVEHTITASIGIAVTKPGDAPQSAETLLRNADTAMYRAKEAGRSCWELFDNAMRVRVKERFEIERELRGALEGSGLFVVYQRLVDVQTGTVVGAEALIRWDRSGFGTLSPSSFLPVAESTGLIVPIGSWVLNRALSDLAKWQSGGSVPEDFRLWVNVSPQQLVNPNFADVVGDRLEFYGVAPESLGLEILEEALLDVGATEKVLTELRALGVSLNLDDFGAGHSNLWWLQELPITGLKIDRRFVSALDAEGDDRGAEIVNGLIGLAHSLGLMVVAEGVETQAQADALNGLGCELAQGFFYGFPGPPEQLWRQRAAWERTGEERRSTAN
jgi:diguanylate cyclase (GGDEF)-like protein